MHTERLGGLDVVQHGADFCFGVQEIACPGADQHVDSDAVRELAGHHDFAVAGCRSAFGDCGAELYASGSSGFGLYAALG